MKCWTGFRQRITARLYKLPKTCQIKEVEAGEGVSNHYYPWREGTSIYLHCYQEATSWMIFGEPVLLFFGWVRKMEL